MKLTSLVLLPFLLLAACGLRQTPLASQSSLLEARQEFRTTLIKQETIGETVPEPPSTLFRVVRYPSPAGNLAAYVSVPPSAERKHPAIIWLVGGFSNSISELAWADLPAENDQSARAFREAGIMMMYASLRGGNDNPGYIEGFYGEVDDVLAAAEYLAQQEGVDPERIYLGGHSTGGTLALLVAASTDRFRAIFSFGPTDDVGGYSSEYLPFDTSNRRELELRSPVKWLHAIQSPTFVFEGTESPGNIFALQALASASRNPLVYIHPVENADHFSVLAPVTRLVAQKILYDDIPNTTMLFTKRELAESLTR